MEQRKGIRTQSRASSAIVAARRLLLEMNKPELAAQLDALERDRGRSRFTVAVVGEFSRGKSTLINRLLGRSVLPVGNMPTTAMLPLLLFLTYMLSAFLPGSAVRYLFLSATAMVMPSRAVFFTLNCEPLPAASTAARSHTLSTPTFSRTVSE